MITMRPTATDIRACIEKNGATRRHAIFGSKEAACARDLGARHILMLLMIRSWRRFFRAAKNICQAWRIRFIMAFLSVLALREPTNLELLAIPSAKDHMR